MTDCEASRLVRRIRGGALFDGAAAGGPDVAALEDLLCHLAQLGATLPEIAEMDLHPVAVLTQLVEGDVYHWGSLMAGALLGSIPVALFYSFFVEHYVSSLTGAVKE